MVMPYHLHMPSYFLETFTEYPFVYIKTPPSGLKADGGVFLSGLLSLFFFMDKGNKKEDFYLPSLWSYLHNLWS